MSSNTQPLARLLNFLLLIPEEKPAAQKEPVALYDIRIKATTHAGEELYSLKNAAPNEPITHLEKENIERSLRFEIDYYLGSEQTQIAGKTFKTSRIREFEIITQEKEPDEIEITSEMLEVTP